MGKDINEVIKRRYNRISPVYEWMDKMIKDQWRKDLLLEATGDVLEVGIGTGSNLLYYPDHITSLTGVDFSQGMLRHAREKVNKAALEFPVHLMEADIQNLPFPDHSFDVIVSTCVFCSVPDPVKGLTELKRVCKPEGKILMLEHMRSGNPMLGGVMDLLNPLTVRLWGANINRKTLENIEKANLTIKEMENLMGTIMRKIEIQPIME
ncbi:class I SAM-dependent methyltransferase [Peribacillus cavernae]|uniref:Class I SAM-dependent methyltransferase n=1 Tax=Peribacillus cavernae TaxID=1674310 RepID=A0A433HUM2_9BACI|nr:class I SAM-dependent methyltransferase [Peribacillus cavernae]MDQ0219983.1 ubiquinone/menaquinone biosynthesis C-methylase UbiE [Peribacillus cavernae]RUQ32048.1 class I SAM-dependent methyltransferase [Peribacillus cavernae]